MSLNFNQFKDWAFLGIIGSGVYLGVYMLSGIKDSVSDLNVKVAVVIKEQDTSKAIYLDHETRLRKLEMK